MSVQKFNPPEVPPPIGYYTHVVVTPPGASLVVLAGQVGVNADGSFPASVEEQFERAMELAMAAAASQGAGPECVVKLTYFLTEQPSDFTRIRGAIQKAFPVSPPAATYVIVQGLARPEIKAEIELFAAVVR